MSGAPRMMIREKFGAWMITVDKPGFQVKILAVVDTIRDAQTWVEMNWDFCKQEGAS